MKGKRTIRQISLTNFLSFGPKGQTLELEPLNVLIGANASGKSNFLEAFRFLRAIPGDLARHVRESGGISELLWKGSGEAPIARIEVVTALEKVTGLKHQLGFSTNSIERFKLREEVIAPLAHKGSASSYAFHDKKGKGVLRKITSPKAARSTHRISVEPDTQHSVISLIKNPTVYPELTALEDFYSHIQFGGGWNLSRFGAVRQPQRTDLPSGALLEDASNLGLILNNFPNKTKAAIVGHLQKVYERLEEIITKVDGNTVQIFFQEKGFELPVSTSRVSEGALRYLCLLVTLLNPTPPPLICLDEPETALHPHTLYFLADLLIEAAQRTQLIVTTQSDELISGLTDVPEAVVVCDRFFDDGTQLQRLKPEQVEPFFDRYALGDLWRMGEIGGLP